MRSPAYVRDLQAASLRAHPRSRPSEASPGQPFQLVIVWEDAHAVPLSLMGIVHNMRIHGEVKSSKAGNKSKHLDPPSTYKHGVLP